MVAGYDDGTLIQVDLDVQKPKTLYTRNQPIKALAAVKGRAANKVRFILSDSGGDVLAAESVLEPVESQATEPGQVTWSASIDGEGRLVVGTVEGQNLRPGSFRGQEIDSRPPWRAGCGGPER